MISNVQRDENLLGHISYNSLSIVLLFSQQIFNIHWVFTESFILYTIFHQLSIVSVLTIALCTSQNSFIPHYKLLHVCCTLITPLKLSLLFAEHNLTGLTVYWLFVSVNVYWLHCSLFICWSNLLSCETPVTHHVQKNEI